MDDNGRISPKNRAKITTKNNQKLQLTIVINNSSVVRTRGPIMIKDDH